MRRVRGAFITSTPTVFVGKTSKSKDYRKDTLNEKPVSNTPGLTSALKVGQNPINDERKTKRSYSPRPKRANSTANPKPERKSQHEASRLQPQGSR